MVQNHYQTVEEYLDEFPEDMREALQKMRILIHRAAPMAVEQVSKGALTYFFHGVVVRFTGREEDILFLVSSTSFRKYRKELVFYRTNAKNAVLFSIYKPLPEKLILDLTALRIRENSDRRMLEVFGRTF